MKMPLYYQPALLEELCYASVGNQLIELCRVLEKQRVSVRQIRNALISTIPGLIRQRLMYCIGQCTRAPIPFHITSLLLASDVEKAKVELCCYYGCSHQSAIFKLLATEGKGLRSLQLARHALLRLDLTLLQSVLLNANHLQEIIMRNISNDATLAVIGSSCERLVTLDVSNSPDVTDNGITNLFIKIELRDKNSTKDLRDVVLHVTSTSTAPTNKWRTYSKAFRSLQTALGSCKGHKHHRVDSFKDILLECHERLNVVASTLKVLNVAGTAVTKAGVFFALDHSKCLQNMGDLPLMGRVFDLFVSKREPLPTLQLKYIRLKDTSTQIMSVLSRLCPKVEVLVGMNVRFSPTYLTPSAFPDTITVLVLFNVPMSQAWFAQFYWFLDNLKNTTLQELVLKFDGRGEIVHIDLGEFLNKCPHLRILVLDNVNIDWRSPVEETRITLLEKVQLGQSLHRKALVNLINHSPNLYVAHIFACPDLHEEDLISLRNKRLHCFFIYKAVLHCDTIFVTELINNCPNLFYMGNITNWGKSISYTCKILHFVKDSTFQLHFKAGAHFYYSPCIKRYE